jgi:hypothetical protein
MPRKGSWAVRPITFSFNDLTGFDKRAGDSTAGIDKLVTGLID